MAGSNWQQLAGGSVNPYDIRRDDGTPTADYGEHIISDGGTVTLPSPKADKAVLVSNISQDTTVTTSTGLVEQQSDVTHLSSVSDPVLFVSDGSNWYVANNLDYLRNIPDSAIANYSSLDDDRSAVEITSIPDTINNNDLSGNAELLSDGINNDKTYRLDGSEIMSVSGLDFNAEPFAVLIAFKQQEALDSNKFIFDFENSSNNVRQFGVNDNGNTSDDLGRYRGGSFGGQNNTLPTSKDVLNLLTIEGHSTNNIKIRQNGADIDDQAIATSSQDEFILAPDRFSEGNLAYDFVEITLLEGYSSVTGQDVTAEEQRIADRHGITLA